MRPPKVYVDIFFTLFFPSFCHLFFSLAPDVWGTSVRTTDADGNVWIEIGSRPFKVSDNDPSVLCSDNEFQSTCSRDEVRQVSVTPSCMDFYNQTDSYLYWYQYVQKYAIFVPDSWTYWRANQNGLCPFLPIVNFYISEENKNSIKLIDSKRGVNLTNFDLYGTINVCYSTPERSLRHVPKLLTRFIQCLVFYGEGIDLSL